MGELSANQTPTEVTVHPQSCRRLKAGKLSGFLLTTLLLVGIHLATPKAIAAQAGRAAIAIDAQQVTGTVSPLLFGHFIEHEHNTIQDGLWAEPLHDRKFEQGDRNHDGVADGWEPEARIADRYWQLVEGQGPNVRYFVDHQEYYGGGASQAIQLYGSGSNHGSVYQIGLQVARGRPYDFYVYLKSRGQGKAFVEFDKVGGPVYGRVRAKNALQRALQLNPDSPVAHYLYAQLEADIGRAQEAMVRLLSRPEINSNDPELFAGLTQVCRYCGLLDASLASHAQALRLDPQIRTSVAHTYFMLGDYRNVLTTSSGGDSLYIHPLALSQLGREREAVELLREHLQRELALPLIRLNGTSLLALLEGRPEDSVRDAEHYIRSSCRDLESYYLARQLAYLGKEARALR